MKVEFEFRISVHLGGVLSRLWAVLLVFLLVSDSALAHADVPAPQYKLVFVEEFNGPDGSAPIFESFGSDRHSCHTAHTHWTVDLGRTKPPISSGKL